MTAEEQFEADALARQKALIEDPSLSFAPVLPEEEIFAFKAPQEVVALEEIDPDTPCRKKDCTGDCEDCTRTQKLGEIVGKLNELSEKKSTLANKLHSFPPEDNEGRAALVKEIDAVDAEIKALILYREELKTGKKPEATDTPDSTPTSADDMRALLNLRTRASKLRAKIATNPDDADLVEKLRTVEEEIAAIEKK